MRGVFLGTPAAAVPALAATADIVDVELVVTQPDAARGRSGRPMPPPVKLAADEWGLPLAQPASHDELLKAVTAVDADIGVVVAYGRLLRPKVLAATRMGYVNVHFSLLPRWRGAAPVERAILEGDATTGVSLMQLDEGLDTGPVISVIETPIADDETGGSLTARLSYLGGAIIDDVLPGYLDGDRAPAPQMEGGASSAPRISVDEARVTAELEPERALRLIRAFRPRPGAWFAAGGERFKVWSAATAADITAAPGTVIARGSRVLLGLDDGVIELHEIQPPGKKLMTAAAWMNGRRGAPLELDPMTDPAGP